jgi:hypothetical protein
VPVSRDVVAVAVVVPVLAAFGTGYMLAVTAVEMVRWCRARLSPGL